MLVFVSHLAAVPSLNGFVVLALMANTRNMADFSAKTIEVFGVDVSAVFPGLPIAANDLNFHHVLLYFASVLAPLSVMAVWVWTSPVGSPTRSAAFELLAVGGVTMAAAFALATPLFADVPTAEPFFAERRNGGLALAVIYGLCHALDKAMTPSAPATESKVKRA